MLSHPTRKSIPTAKLSANNAGDVELTTNRRAIAANSAAVHPQSTPAKAASTLPHPQNLTPWSCHQQTQPLNRWLQL